jgi:hypothetical protein
MKRLTQLIALSSFLFITSFNFQSSKNENLYFIPLAKNITNLSEIKCSQFIDRFEYIQLETNEKCLIPDSYQAIILKNHILIYSFKFCYVFDRRTGEFLCEIGKNGRGPEEYQQSLIAYDYINSVIYSLGWKDNVMVFGLDGKYLREFPIPPPTRGMEAPSFMQLYSCLPNSYIVGYHPNILGIETKLLTVFNQKGEVIKVFPNRNVYPKRPLKMLDLLDAQFYYMENNTYFKERSDDTVFKVTEKSLTPHLIFEMGKFTVPYEYKWWPPEERKKVNFILVNNIFENSTWVHILAEKESIEFFGMYNKITRQLNVSKNGDGIPNDIDNFIPFNPKYMDEEGNLVQFINATKISNWFKENNSKISERINVLRNVDISQNPIVVIGKTKNINTTK